MTDRLDQLNAGIEKMFPFCHAVLYAIVGTFFRASAVVTNDGAKPCNFARPKNSQENPGSSCAKSCPSPVAIGQPQITQSEDWYKNKRPPVPELDTTSVFRCNTS
jgi:hypothetical protein